MGTRSTVFRVALAGLTALLLALLSFGSGFVVASFQPTFAEWAPSASLSGVGTKTQGPLDVFREAWDLVEQDFIGPLPPSSDRVYGAARGLLSVMDDPYTVFVEPVPHQFDQDNLRGSYGGIGVTLSPDAEGNVVLSPFRDSPAVRAGIRDGDVLVAVDKVPITADLDISQDVAVLIRGDVGTDVTLTIRRGEEVLDLAIEREVIETPSISWRLLDQAPTLGYIGITSFTDRTPTELIEGLGELQSDSINGLVVDLRDNGGGLLQSSIDVVGEFLDAETVVLYEQRKGQPEKTYTAQADGYALDIPLVVLVNGGTASASEIVAGAIQDHGRGTLVGERTFGKGSVQLIFDLSDGSSLHVTAARWLTPRRHQLDQVGLTPDIEINQGNAGEGDRQLERAIEVLQLR